MTNNPFDYPVDACDVPAVRRKSLTEYRLFRGKCLDYLRGDSPTSVMNQVRELAWHTAVFRTLNEARRLDADRPVNGALWELTTAGFVNLMTLGIRRLVDADPRTDSLWNVVAQVEKRPELLTREKFVCYDGLPFDVAMAHARHAATLDMTQGYWVGSMSTKGPLAWATAEMLHKGFDALSGWPSSRRRLDTIDVSVLANLKAALQSPCIEAVCTLADKRMAHAERLPESAAALPAVTFDDVDQALCTLVRVANFLCSRFFYDVAFASVVPTPQFDVLEALDQPWVSSVHLPALHRHWQRISDTMGEWAVQTADGFLPPRPTPSGDASSARTGDEGA
jgi:hypothetical protein